jgi:hypothetical protein
VTGAMMSAANNQLKDMPSEAEIKLFREAGVPFQLVSVVLSIAHMDKQDGVLHGIPYALTLVPASKRDVVQESGIDLVAKLDIQKILNETEPCYVGFDPFDGTWTFYGPLSLFARDKPYNGFLDELGIVVAQYFLATAYNADDVLEVALGLPTPKAEKKYGRHRAKLLYNRFATVEARRLWGAQSPIELFLLEELLLRASRQACRCSFSRTAASIRRCMTCGTRISNSATPLGLSRSAICSSPKKKLRCFATPRGIIAVRKRRRRTRRSTSV